MLLGWQKEVQKLIHTGGISDLVREPNNAANTMGAP